MNLQEILLTLAIDIKLLIGGLIGAIIGYKGKVGSWWQKVGSFVFGVCSAVYVTPLIYEIMELKDERSKIGVAVFVGYFGINGLQKILLKKLEQWKQ